MNNPIASVPISYNAKMEVSWLISGYKYKTGLDYTWYRIVNAIKHIFDQSDWDRARKILLADLRSNSGMNEGNIKKIAEDCLEAISKDHLHEEFVLASNRLHRTLNHLFTLFNNNANKLGNPLEFVIQEEVNQIKTMLKVNPESDLSRFNLSTIATAFQDYLHDLQNEGQALFPLPLESDHLNQINAVIENSISEMDISYKVSNLIAPYLAKRTIKERNFLSSLFQFYKQIQNAPEGSIAKEKLFKPLDLFPRGRAEIAATLSARPLSNEKRADVLIKPLIHFLMMRPGLICNPL